MTLPVIRAALLAAALPAGALLLACNESGLSRAPRAVFSQLACQDINGDHRLNENDVRDPSRLPDFDADGARDDQDAAFFRGLDIPLDPRREADACKGGSASPEYAVAHGYFKSANVTCRAGENAVLLVGVGGGAVNLKDRDDAAGVRSMIDGIQKEYDDQGTQTIAVLAGPAIAGAQNIHSAMEQWITHAVHVYLDRYPCLRVVLLGHSHGAITVDVAAAALEPVYGYRIIEVVDVDRVDVLYVGDTKSRPRSVHVFNVYQRNPGPLQSAPYDAPNVENWDAGSEHGPRDGDKGGPLVPVEHTNIDNSASVKQRIIDRVISRP